MATKRIRLPKGLREFGGSLSDPRWSGELMKRLLDLPENGLHADVARHAEALVAAATAQQAAEAALERATKLAEATFRKALSLWSIKEIQAATGYDDE